MNKNLNNIAESHRNKKFTPMKLLSSNIFNRELKINLHDLNIQNQSIHLCPMVTSAYCKIKVPQEIIDNLNKYLDKLYKDPNAESRGDKLVGAIKMLSGKKGKQLAIDMDDELVKPFSLFIVMCSRVYINSLYNQDINNMATQIILDEIWSVHQYETDYNPKHFHSNSISDFGLSAFMHIQLPEQLLEKNKTNKKANNGEGWWDGRTTLNWGNTYSEDYKALKFGQSMLTTGETGVLYLFPQWLEHFVYPFFGEGERRTVAANIAMKF